VKANARWKCPNPVCKSGKINTVNTVNAGDERMPNEYSGLELVRRRKKCLDCGETFHTIEVMEPIFKHLSRKPGRLETPQPSVRPGMGAK
jgi:transcriptional regulator NrdR family protein